MPNLNVPTWSGAQKFQFSNGNGTFACQSNPTTYTLNPQTAAAAQPPAKMGPVYLNGAYETPPTGIALEWQEMAEADYLTIKDAYHLQPTTMIDMDDNGYYGWLQIGSAEYLVGAVQRILKVTAIFITSTPANGLHSTIATLATPSVASYSVSTGGSLSSSTSLYYCFTDFSRWGETAASPVLTVSTGATSNAAVTLTWTAPSSTQFRKRRIYTASSAAGLAAGSTATVLAEVWVGMTQSYIDTCNMNGNTNTATVPTSNVAYLGQFSGAKWRYLP
jgi:hypothetical protein